jgi:hypothetical protein
MLPRGLAARAPEREHGMQSHEVATFWRYIAGSLDRLLGILDGLGEKEPWAKPS